MRLIISLMVLVIMSSSAMAYTLLDYDEINYIATAEQLYAYGWRNSTTSDGVGNCYTASYRLYCQGTGSYESVHHLFNQGNGECISANRSINGRKANFSLRFDINLQDLTIGEVSRVGVAQSLTTNPATDLYLYLKHNTSGKTQFCLRSSATENCVYQPTAADDVTYRVQMDYSMVESLSTPPNITMNYLYLWVDGDYKGGQGNVASTKFACLNTTAFTFSPNDPQYIDDIELIIYDYNETFINANASTGNITYNCSDGIDNDADGYFDLADPSCDSATDSTETPFDLNECNDGDDNDGDGMIDYPNDPACANATSGSEFPANYFQCNDGIDNDVDGQIDYPQDTGCSNYNDNSELPKSGTAQESDECSQGTACLYKDTFPYTDGIEWHGWSYDIDYSPPAINCSQSSPCNTLTPSLYVSGASNYDLRLTAIVNTNFQRVTLYRNFSNTNSYNDAVFKIVTAIKRTSAITNESIHEYIRYGTSTLAEIRIDFTTATSGAYRTKAYIWATSGGQYYLAGTAYLNDDYDGTLETIIVADQVNGSYKLYFVDETSSTQQTTDNTYYFTTSNVPDNLYVESDADNMDLWVKEVHGYGVPEGSVCTSFTKPYYLKEEFIYGFLTDCGWTASDNFVMLGELQIDQSLGQFDAYKTTSEDIEQTKFRYVTIEWDEYISSTQPTSNPVNNIYLKDADGNLIVQVYFMPDGKLYSVPDLTPDQITTISTETYVNIKLVLDLLEEQFNLYIDDSLFTTSSQVPFYDSDYDTQTLRYFSISSLTSNYKMDNIQIYTSDSTGGQLVGTDEITTRVYKNDVLGLWFKNTTKCATDDDCESGQCQPYGTCSQFNFKACDEEQLPRGNWCMIRLTTGRTLENAGDIMLDNFLYLVVFIVILMILLYIAIMFRR